jgi:peroxidase
VYDIPKGRKDGRRSKIEDTINLPFPTFNASELVRVFGKRGFSAQDMVALSGKYSSSSPIKLLGVSRCSSSFCGHHLVYAGAHTLGVARCSSFKTRLSDPVDPTMDSDFSKALAKTCSGGDNAEQSFDVTRNNFDSFYFQALQRKAGVLFSDQTLYNNPETKAIVNNYAMNQAMFFLDFQQAMVKMSLLDVKEGSKGEVRADCRKVN